MTNRVKIAVSLRPDQVEAARHAVEEGLAESVSAYIGEALDRYRADDSLAALARDLVAENGEPSASAKAWADQIFPR